MTCKTFFFPKALKFLIIHLLLCFMKKCGHTYEKNIFQGIRYDASTNFLVLKYLCCYSNLLTIF